jgi:biotin operon repressor
MPDGDKIDGLGHCYQPAREGAKTGFKSKMGHDIVRAMRKRKLPANEMAVWTVMGDHASDKDGTRCFISQQTIARESGYTDRTVRTILRKLEQRGAIVETRKPGYQTTREYRMILDAVPINSESVRPENFSGLERIEAVGKAQTGNPCTADRKSTSPDRKFTTARPENFSAKPSEPSEEPSKENPLKTRARESRDVVIGIASGLAREMKIPDSERRQRHEGSEHRDRLKRHAHLLNSGKTIDEIKAFEAAGEEQARIKINQSNGVTQVTPPLGKYGGL